MENLKLFVECKDEKGSWMSVKTILGRVRVSGNIESEEWVEHFEKVFGAEEQQTMGYNKVKLCINLNNTGEFEDVILIGEVERVVKGLKSGKSGGLNGMGTDFFKEIGKNHRLIELFVNLFNAIFSYI